MILPFTQQIDGKATYFVEKIHAGLYYNNLIDFDLSCDFIRMYIEKTDPSLIFNQLTNPVYKGISKIQTIREDKKDRWQVGNKIHFTINNRTKNSFQFAPVIPVKATQEIFMTRRGSLLEISIAKADSYIGGDDFYADAVVNGLLSQNDGFDEYEDFRNFFCAAIERNGKETGNYWFKGKIIHWTDFKY